jgi:signal transduction histidine kinase
VLGVLRGDHESAPRAPGGLDGLDALVRAARTAGLTVRVERTGDPAPLPAAVDLAAFRIVQEAITNTLRHGGPGVTTSAVRLHHGDDALSVRIDDDGRDGAASGLGEGTGSGLVGMRERAATLGGELTAGPRPGGGFRVEARLPITAAEGDGPPPATTSSAGDGHATDGPRSQTGDGRPSTLTGVDR